MDIIKFIIDYFFIEPFLAPWPLADKILHTTFAIVGVLYIIDIVKNKLNMRKKNKQIEVSHEKINLQDNLGLMNKLQ